MASPSYAAVQVGQTKSAALLEGAVDDHLDCEVPDALEAELPAARSRPRAVAVCLVAAATLMALACAALGRTPAFGRMVADELMVLDMSFDCTTELENWQRGWSSTKKHWCCTNMGKACSGDDEGHTPGLVPFNCAAGYVNWEEGWSTMKKVWCCSHEDKGCPPPTHVSITFVIANINYQALRNTIYILQGFSNAVRQVVVDQADNDVSDTCVKLMFWAGSGLHSQIQTPENTGVVVRARIAVPSVELVPSVRAYLQDHEFPGKIEVAVRRVVGIDMVTIGEPSSILVYDLEVEMPIVDACTCPNGKAEEPPTCPKEGGQMCKACNTGFHLSSSLSCEPNVCTCKNGDAVDGTLCKLHNSEKCAYCLDGFHISGAGRCEPNVCTCPNGYGANGRECGQDLAEICAACNPGYFVDPLTKLCEPSTCTCRYGTPAAGEACRDDQAQICAACDPGYHLTISKTCEPNICTCKNGEPALEALCLTDRAEICAYCNVDLHLQGDGTCGNRVCFCPNGTAATDSACHTHHATVCTKCEFGFDLRDQQCISRSCTCQNGSPRPGATCARPGQSICGSCKRGFHLYMDRCEPNRCTCSNGAGALGPFCPDDGGVACSNCSPGFHHELRTVETVDGPDVAIVCVENVCSCKYNGVDVGERATAATSSKCPATTTGEPRNYCVSCMDGYILENNQCVPNRCFCLNGQPVVENCLQNGTHSCLSCYNGFFLASGPPGNPIGNPSFPDFSGGAKCLPNSITTTAPFDCGAGLKNFQADWSLVKKEWCCTNQKMGCGDGNP